MTDLLPNLLISSAQKHPENIAVKYRTQEISYAELNVLSSQLSFSLMERGIKIGDRVGLYLDKSIESVISIFAILKAGACYVPLEPMGPAQRQLEIMNECSMKCLITASKKIFRLQELLVKKTPLGFIILIDGEKKKTSLPVKRIIYKEDIEKAKYHPFPSLLKENSLAYIFYTSGSTGKPKGIMFSHRASLSFINWAYEYFSIGPEEKISAHAPFHFDLSIFDIFVTIKAGAAICIVPQGMSAFPQSLAEFIEKEKISTWYSVPSVLINLILYGKLESKNLSALKRIIYAGETFPLKYLRKLIKTVPQAKYYNLYGPTETNVCTCYALNPLSLKKFIPIGKSIKGVTTFVIKENGAFAPKGERGELYVSGPTLMDGYWNDAEKTKSVLFKNPFHLNRDTVVYKTGDIVKIDSLGNYLFLGRYDNMVKSRGYRIQLEEIELVLNKHPKVKEAIVTAIPDELIGKILKAVIIPKNKNSLKKEEIKTFCLKKLPAYMLPEIIEFQTALPRTSTGKINRRRLI